MVKLLRVVKISKAVKKGKIHTQHSSEHTVYGLFVDPFSSIDTQLGVKHLPIPGNLIHGAFDPLINLNFLPLSYYFMTYLIFSTL